jgi:hypothetical protein
MSSTFGRREADINKSPIWSYWFFFLGMFFLITFIVPWSYQTIKSDFLLMSPKYKVNRWSAGDLDVDFQEWAKLKSQLIHANTISPDNPDVLLYLANLNALRAFKYEADEKYIKAYLYESVDYYLDALNLKPADPLLWVNYAKVLSVVAPESEDYQVAKENATILAKNESYLSKIVEKLN